METKYAPGDILQLTFRYTGAITHYLIEDVKYSDLRSAYYHLSLETGKRDVWDAGVIDQSEYIKKVA